MMKFNVEEKSKQLICDYLQKSIDKEVKLVEHKLNSTFSFGKEVFALNEKDINELIKSMNKEILTTIGNVSIICDIAEIDCVVKRTFQVTIDKETFQKISKNTQKISLQICFRRHQKFYVDKPDFKILHFGKDVDLEIIKKSIIEKRDIITIELLFIDNPIEGEKWMAEFNTIREAWLYFTQFLHTWTHHH